MRISNFLVVTIAVKAMLIWAPVSAWAQSDNGPQAPSIESKDTAKELSSGVVRETSIPTLRAPGKIVLGIISSDSKNDFESKIAPFFKEQWANCSSCELRNLSTYDEKGNFNDKLQPAQLEAAVDGLQFLLINVNWRYKAEEHKPLADLLKKLMAKNILILGAAGYPKEGESSAPLSRTLLSQVPDLIIIGEINERERLLGSSYFGPEMLTAIKPPREYIGKGLGPSFFAAKLAQNYTRKLPVDWLSHFRTQKMKSRKIWPQVEEFFQR